MSLDDRTLTLTTVAQVDAFLDHNPLAVLLKLGTCHKNTVALREVERQLDTRPSLPLGLIHVVEAREASNHVATRTGITHESPQLIVFRDGEPLFERNNWDITPQAVEQALALLAGACAPEGEAALTAAK